MKFSNAIYILYLIEFCNLGDSLQLSAEIDEQIIRKCSLAPRVPRCATVMQQLNVYVQTIELSELIVVG